jgi:hypothetical protein
MEQMFKINKIPMDMSNLVKLFYKPTDDGHKSTDNKDELDFNSLVNYAISSTTDEKYREYMRNIKTKMDKNNSKEDLYIPMNFNSLLEHFNSKGKIREKMQDVSETIGKMEKMTVLPKESKILPNNEQENKIHNDISYSKIVKSFEDIVRISSESLDKIRSHNNVERINANFNLIKFKDESNITDKNKKNLQLPMIDSTNFTDVKNSYDNYCPSNMKSFYNVISTRTNGKNSIKAMDLKKMHIENQKKILLLKK